MAGAVADTDTAADTVMVAAGMWAAADMPAEYAVELLAPEAQHRLHAVALAAAALAADLQAMQVVAADTAAADTGKFSC